MTNTGYDPQLLQQKAQAQLQAALRNHLPSAEPNSNKRHSSSSHSSETQFPKRAAVSRSSTTGDQSLHGFTKIPLPSPPLSRTFSTPIPSHEINGLNHVQSSNFPAAASTRLPEGSSGVNSVPSHSLYRSSSAPIPEAHMPAPSSTPPRPPAAGKVEPLPPTPSPDAKRGKRIQERIIQMKKLWDDVMEEEEEDAASQNALHCPHKDDCEASNASGTEILCDEPVWVEMRGDIRVLHFKCHCSKAYQILLSGNDCYYKL